MKKLILILMTLIFAATFVVIPASAEGNKYITEVCNKNTARLIIGDSRCVQLYRVGKKSSSFVAVWGGHYGSGFQGDYTINTTARRSRMKRYIKASVNAKGKCSVFIFATINDYSFGSGYESYMDSLIRQACELKKYGVKYGGKTVRPKVYIVKLIGFEPEHAQYNKNIPKYNKRLTKLAKSYGISTLDLSGCLEGSNQGYRKPNDLHYNKKTLANMWKVIKKH